MGSVGSQSNEITIDTVSGEFDVSMAVYEDDSFTKVVDSDHEVIVPDHIFLGLVLNAHPQFILRATRCWITPDANANNVVQFAVVEDGCKNSNVSSIFN